MKIYFEDGKLRQTLDVNIDGYIIMIDAGEGFNTCYNQLRQLREYERVSNVEYAVYTNLSAALNNYLTWNEELRLPEVYLRRNDRWIRIDQLTARELRAAHNLEKMWISGAFEPYEKEETKQWFQGDNMDIKDYKFNVGDITITTDGIVGRIDSICTCSQCKVRGFYEPHWRPIFEDTDNYDGWISKFDAEHGFVSYCQIGKYKFRNFDDKRIKARIDSYIKLVESIKRELDYINYVQANNITAIEGVQCRNDTV